MRRALHTGRSERGNRVVEYPSKVRHLRVVHAPSQDDHVSVVGGGGEVGERPRGVEYSVRRALPLVVARVEQIVVPKEVDPRRAAARERHYATVEQGHGSVDASAQRLVRCARPGGDGAIEQGCQAEEELEDGRVADHGQSSASQQRARPAAALLEAAQAATARSPLVPTRGGDELLAHAVEVRRPAASTHCWIPTPLLGPGGAIQMVWLQRAPREDPVPIEVR
mmetsp:Transcript_33923/g.99719  ORF Transcript_33923/g.99719 Transcript_33923/m.99719 type:complete len:224 (+) Transcript_33923:148-819(+)